MSGHHEVLEQLRGPTRGLRTAIPDVWDGFLALHRAGMAMARFQHGRRKRWRWPSRR